MPVEAFNKLFKTSKVWKWQKQVQFKSAQDKELTLWDKLWWELRTENLLAISIIDNPLYRTERL